MNAENVAKACREAKEFVARAQAVLTAAKLDQGLFFGSKATGSLKRQSLELTRALAEMRK